MLIVANWKAYVDSKEKAKKLFAAAKRLSTVKRVKIVLAPPTPYLGLLALNNRTKIMFAAQDVSEATAATVTGEVTAPILKSMGVKYVIIGHSERRRRGESDELITEKVRRALANGITPILCIGERERDPDARYLAFLRNQIVSVFSGLSPKERLGIIIAYEPIFAIGKTAADALNSADVAEMVLYIRKVLSELGISKTGIKILYGASVEPENIRGLAGGSGVDGFLVGHASADPAMFSAFVKTLT